MGPDRAKALEKMLERNPEDSRLRFGLALEYLRSVTDVNWSYATPAKNFTNGPRTGVFRIGGDTILEDKKGKSRISRADFAVALIDEAESAAHNKQRFSVAY